MHVTNLLGSQPVEDERRRDRRFGAWNVDRGAHGEGHEDVAQHRVVAESREHREATFRACCKLLRVPDDEVDQRMVRGLDALGCTRGAGGEQEIGDLFGRGAIQRIVARLGRGPERFEARTLRGLQLALTQHVTHAGADKRCEACFVLGRGLEQKHATRSHHFRELRESLSRIASVEHRKGNACAQAPEHCHHELGTALTMDGDRPLLGSLRCKHAGQQPLRHATTCELQVAIRVVAGSVDDREGVGCPRRLREEVVEDPDLASRRAELE